MTLNSDALAWNTRLTRCSRSPRGPDQLAPPGMDERRRCRRPPRAPPARLRRRSPSSLRLPGKRGRSTTSSSAPPASPSSTAGTTAAARPRSGEASSSSATATAQTWSTGRHRPCRRVRDLLADTPYADVDVEAALAWGNVRGRRSSELVEGPRVDHLGHRPDRGEAARPGPAVVRRGPSLASLLAASSQPEPFTAARFPGRRRGRPSAVEAVRACFDLAGSRFEHAVPGHPSSRRRSTENSGGESAGGTDVRRSHVRIWPKARCQRLAFAIPPAGARAEQQRPFPERPRAERPRNGNGKVATGGNGQVATNGNGGVKTLPKPAKLDEQLPVVSTNGNGFPVAAKLPEHHRRFYLPLKLKLVFVALCSLAWVGFSLWLAIPWIDELGQSITVPLAAAVIAGIAIIPGYLNAHLISSLLIDRPPPLRFDVDFPAITLIVACFNEEDVDRGDPRLRLPPRTIRASSRPRRRRRLHRPDRRAGRALRRARPRGSRSAAARTAARPRP